MNTQNFDTINSNDLDTVTGGSIVGNAATTGGVGAIIGSFFPGPGTAIGGGVGLALGAAASIGHGGRQARHRHHQVRLAVKARTDPLHISSQGYRRTTMSELLRTLDVDTLNTVTGGSITGNASLGTALLGPAYGLVVEPRRSATSMACTEATSASTTGATAPGDRYLPLRRRISSMRAPAPPGGAGAADHAVVGYGMR